MSLIGILSVTIYHLGFWELHPSCISFRENTEGKALQQRYQTEAALASAGNICKCMKQNVKDVSKSSKIRTTHVAYNC